MRSLLVLLIILNISSCTKYKNETLENRKISINSANRKVKVNDSMALMLNGYDLHNKDLIIKWSADFGRIKGNGLKVMYYAPASSVPEIIEVTITDKADKDNFSVSANLLIFQQLVILKADDMQFNERNVISPNWSSFIHYIKSKGIKASIGIIGNSLETGNSQYYDTLKSLAGSGNFELWNHGYNHVLDGKDQNGNFYEEFLNTSYDYQIEHLVRTQNLAKEKLNIVLRTFGAPGNAIDSTTIRAVDDLKDIHVWLFGLDKTAKLNLKRFGDMEYPTGNPVFSLFEEHYLPQKEYLVFQIHPNVWDEKKFSEFKKMIDFLMSKDVTFLTPSDYFQLVN